MWIADRLIFRVAVEPVLAAGARIARPHPALSAGDDPVPAAAEE